MMRGKNIFTRFQIKIVHLFIVAVEVLKAFESNKTEIHSQQLMISDIAHGIRNRVVFVLLTWRASSLIAKFPEHCRLKRVTK